jgi:hypothetical protein
MEPPLVNGGRAQQLVPVHRDQGARRATVDPVKFPHRRVVGPAHPYQPLERSEISRIEQPDFHITEASLAK